MKTLYLVRHGQTLFNVLRRKQGFCDSPLTDLGIEQAKACGQWFLAQNIHFESGFSSTSERASDTFELICPNTPYTRVKNLREWNFGKFEGITEDLNIQVPYGDFYVQFGGESELALRERIYRAIYEIMDTLETDKTLIVSHGAAIAQFTRAVLGHDELPGHIGNCSVSIFSFDNGHFEFKELVITNPDMK